MKKILYHRFCIISLILLLNSCSLYIDSFTADLNKAVKSSNDPQTIMQALPAYIVLLDGLLEADPEDKNTLLASAALMNAYSSLLGSQFYLIDDIPEYKSQRVLDQQKILNKKSLDRTQTAICIHSENFCQITNLKYDELKIRLQTIHEEDIDILYKMATAWVSWLEVNKDDWNALAQVAQIKLILQIVLDNNEIIDNGNAHVYLGVMNSLIPATLGGKPEIGKNHFIAAIRMSGGSNLMAKVLYAQYYARLMFDEKLHDKLISEVLKINDSGKKLSLINTLAVEKAKALKQSATDYF
jgi:TRAP transporter TatT component family protein